MSGDTPAPPPGPGGGSNVDDDWLAAALAAVEAAEQEEPDEPVEPDRVVLEDRVAHSFPTSFAGAAALPEVRSLADLADHDGARVRLVGTWEPVDVRMLALGAPVYRGHVRIRLVDEASAAVLILPMWADAARRSRAEVLRYEGSVVTVVGTAMTRAPEAPDGRATAIGPCVVTVDAVLS